MPYRKRLLPTTLAQRIEELKLLQKGFDDVSDHVIITDEHANILYANSAVQNATGFSIDEVIGKNPADLWGGKMPREFYEDMWHQIKVEKKPFVGEVRNVRKDGQEYWQELHISPIVDAEGNVKFFIGIEPNITERKLRDQFREQFVSILSHQALTPLSGMRWALQWLFESGGLNKEQHDTLEAVYKHSEGLVDLINDLIFLSRLGAGHPQSEHFNLETEVEIVIKNAQEQHPNVSFFFSADDPVSLYANKALVDRLLTNIIFNAAEYSDKKNEGKVTVTLKKGSNAYIFLCTDNGIGIPEQEQGRMFSRFFRASNVSEIKKSGSGLGLFISKMIADGYEWPLSFESVSEKGTTFSVEIPFGWKLKS